MTSQLSRTHSLGLTILALLAASVAAQGVMTTNGQLVAASGGTASGLPFGVTFGYTTPSVFSLPVMAPSGSILFRAHLVGTNVTTLDDRALILGHASGDLRAVLREGETDPSGTFPNSQLLQTNGATGLPTGLGTFESLRMTCSLTPPFAEIVLFQARLYDPTGFDGLTSIGTAANNEILYWGNPAPGGLQILARRGITTMPDGAVLLPVPFSVAASSLNTSGTAVFRANLSTTLGTPSPPVTTANDQAWIHGTPGNLAYLIREGDQVFGGNCVIGSFGGSFGSNPILNESGQMLHSAYLSLVLGSTPATTANDEVVLVTTAGVHNVLMREGDLAFDAASVQIPGVFYGDPTLAEGFSNSSKAAFHCRMTGAVTATDDGAVFIGDTTSTAMVLREGDVAPGTGGGTISVIGVGSATLNFSEAGAVVGVTLAAPGVTASNDSALYLCKVGAVPLLLAREGDPVPGMPSFSIGAIGGSSNFGSQSDGIINGNGHVNIRSMRINDGTVQRTASLTWHPVLGLQVQLVENDLIGGVAVSSTNIIVDPSPSGDSAPLGMNLDGDFVLMPQTTSATFVVRGKCGTLAATPSSVPVAGGVPQNFLLDAGPTNGLLLYAIVASSAGTRPGLAWPFGGEALPLNYDLLWTDLSIQFGNSPVWVNNIGFTDANGKGIGPAAFVMPAGYPGFLGTTIHHAGILLDGSLTAQHTTEPCALKFY